MASAPVSAPMAVDVKPVPLAARPPMTSAQRSRDASGFPTAHAFRQPLGPASAGMASSHVPSTVPNPSSAFQGALPSSAAAPTTPLAVAAAAKATPKNALTALLQSGLAAATEQTLMLQLVGALYAVKTAQRVPVAAQRVPVAAPEPSQNERMGDTASGTKGPLPRGGGPFAVWLLVSSPRG